MISSTQRVVQPTSGRAPVISATSRAGNLFGNQLSSALRKASGKTTLPGDLVAPSKFVDPKSVSDVAPAATNSSSAGQNVGTAKAPPAPLLAPAADASSPVDVLSAALQAAGIDPKALGMSAHDQICTYPGGSYINHLITVTAPNGRTQDYMSNLMMLSPNVTVTEIKHLLTS